ncbi:MAG: methyltransferase, partial [Pseudomonadota bacterium]
LLITAACAKQPETESSDVTAQAETADAAAMAAKEAMPDNAALLAAALDALPEDHKQRYAARNPAATLEFFGIEPGMTVVEALPGGGWYTKILAPYLGSEGTVIGVDYALEMFPLFGFFSAEALEAKKTWAADFVSGTAEWRGENDAAVEAFVFGSMDEQCAGRADAVLMIRALHNLNRFETEGGYRTAALSDAFSALKSGGILGVVQHHGAEDMPDEWANGSNGYLKKDALIADIEAAGFEFVASSDINANPADQPGAEDIVWRLPPTLATSRDDEAMRAEMIGIGESNRMTLKFRKP